MEWRAAWSVAAAHAAGALLTWPTVPARIPLHFDLGGMPDRWVRASPVAWFALPVVSLAVLALLRGAAVVARRSPHLWGLPGGVRLPELPRGFRREIERSVERYVAWVAVVTAVMLAALHYAVHAVATGRSPGIPLPVEILLWGSVGAILVGLVPLRRRVKRLVEGAAGPGRPSSERPSELRHGTAAVGDVRLHYVEAGAGPLLLFLHGFPEFWYMWRAQLAELGKVRRAVALDLRGYNRSSKPGDVAAYRLDRLVDDVTAVADHFGSESFDLVGHDWGGVIAWVVAARRPERLRRLAVINAPHPAIFRRELRENPEQREASRYMGLLASPSAEEALAADDFAYLERAVLRPGLEAGYLTGKDHRAYREAWARPGTLTGMVNYYRANLEGLGAPAPGDAGERGVVTAAGIGNGTGEPAGGGATGRISVPTLVLWGERDRYLLPGNLEGLDRHVTDLIVRRVPDAGHWIVHEQPDRVTAELRAFLSEPDA